MELSSKIEFVLGCSMKPSEKIALITLIVAEKPLTTIELNAFNNCYKTFDNYKVLYADHIESGLVRVEAMKASNGITRQHFSIDDAVLEELIEET